MGLKLTPKTRLIITISISFAFFGAEIASMTCSTPHTAGHLGQRIVDTNCSWLLHEILGFSCRCFPLCKTSYLDFANLKALNGTDERSRRFHCRTNSTHCKQQRLPILKV
jgi:hypothetical protein